MVYQDTIIPFSKCQLYTPLFRYTTSNITYTVYGSPACEPYLTVLPDLCRVTVIGIPHSILGLAVTMNYRGKAPALPHREVCSANMPLKMG